MTFSISYIVVTKNRLPFLKILFDQFVANCEADEEIVVVDGNSTDGSKEYLTDLFDRGIIHQFISEPDRNQAEAWNKGFLMARGTIIKKLIDDDVHSLTAIRLCRDFMLQNPTCDVCISNSLESSLFAPSQIGRSGRKEWFEEWNAGKINVFTFGDVYLLIRRKSLSFIGLYDTQFKMLDWEYSLRMTSLKAKIAYYTGCNSLSVYTPGNVSSTATLKQLKLEGEIGKKKYNYAGDRSKISAYSRLKIAIGKLLYSLRSKSKALPPPAFSDAELSDIYAGYYSELARHNNDLQGGFLF